MKSYSHQTKVFLIVKYHRQMTRKCRKVSRWKMKEHNRAVDFSNEWAFYNSISFYLFNVFCSLFCYKQYTSAGSVSSLQSPEQFLLVCLMFSLCKLSIIYFFAPANSCSQFLQDALQWAQPSDDIYSIYNIIQIGTFTFYLVTHRKRYFN